MARPQALETSEVVAAMSELHADWDLVSGKLHRDLVFSTFAEAFGFMSEIAIAADKIDHHPEWSNVYNRVAIDLTTHEVDGFSVSDIQLAKTIDAAAEKRIA